MMNTMISQQTNTQRLYGFMLYLKSKKEHHEKFNTWMVLLYLLINLVSFLCIIGIFPSSIFHNPILAIILASLTLLTLLEVTFSALYLKQFHLFAQLSLFRFGVFNILLIFFRLEVHTPTYLSPQLSIFLMLLLFGYASSISLVTVYQDLKDNSLNPSPIPITFLLLLGDTLLFVYDISSPTGKFLPLMLFGGLSLLTRVSHFSDLKEESLPYKLLSSVNSVNLAYFFLLLLKFLSVLETALPPLFILFLCLILYLCLILNELIRKRTFLFSFKELFTCQMSLHVFLKVMQLMVDEIDRLNNFQNTKFSNTYLFALCYHHSAHCSHPNCELSHESTTEELKNCLEIKNVKILIHKILKKLDRLFEHYLASQHENVQLNVVYLRFCTRYLSNKVKIDTLIANLGNLPLTFLLAYDVYTFKVISSQDNTKFSVKDLQEQADFSQFQNVMFWTMECMLKFWSQFYQDRVDLNELLLISARLFPLKSKLQEFWKKAVLNDKFTSWKILSLYSFYRRRILNDVRDACIIDSYIDILGQRLREYKDIQYLTAETELCIIAISLSESSLGQIVSTNSQACNAFNYTKSNFLKARVNDIMPKIYSVNHDEILESFLKNKAKRINPDQRPLFGRNANGFIFPIFLQLQSVSSTSNDELIFIANVKIKKIKLAPIYAFTTLTGEINDYTHSFHQMFTKPRFLSQNNIQNIIPTFFKKCDSIGDLTKSIIFPQIVPITYRNVDMNVHFEVQPIILRAKNVGYLVKCIRESTQLTLYTPPYGLNLTTYILNRCKYTYKGTYDGLSNRYTFPDHMDKCQMSSNHQATIPYLHSSWFTTIFKGFNQKAKDYGEGIRTLRFTDDHFQRVDTQQSFSSADEKEEVDIHIVHEQIEQLKEDLIDKSQRDFLRRFKMFLHVCVLSITVFAIVVLIGNKQYYDAELNTVSLLKYKTQIRAEVPQLVLYYSAISMNMTPRSTSQLNRVKDSILSALQPSQISQAQQQKILQLIYLQDKSNLPQILLPTILEFQYPTNDALSITLPFWYLLLSFTLAIIISQSVVFYFFKQALLSIYTIFLGLQEDTVRSIYSNCLEMMSKIGDQSTNSDLSNRLKDVKDEVGGESDNEFQKVRRFKNTSQSKDSLYLFQLVLPAIILLGFNIAVFILMTTLSSSYSSIKQVYFQVSFVLPQSSVSLLNGFQSTILSTPLNLPTTRVLQSITKVIYESTSNSQQYMNILMGDICSGGIPFGDPINDPLIDSIQYCKGASAAVAGTGLDNSLNYIDGLLLNLNQGGSYFKGSGLQELIELEYGYVAPTVTHLLRLIEKNLLGELNSYKTTCDVLCFLIIALLMILEVYLSYYPFHELTKSMNFTKDLIQLMPPLQ